MLLLILCSSWSKSEGKCLLLPSCLLPELDYCLGSFGLEAHGTSSVLWDICALFPLVSCHGDCLAGHVFLWLIFLAGWELMCASVCISASPPSGSPADQLLQEGMGNSTAARFWEVFEALSPSRPCSVAHSPACNFNMGEAGLSVLAESSNWSSFWQRMGSIHQDHIPDAGSEILEG